MAAADKDPKKNILTVRLTDLQLETLRNYVKVKGLNTEGDGIRRMIEGAADWVKKSDASSSSAKARIDRLEERVQAIEERLGRQDILSSQPTSHHVVASAPPVVLNESNSGPTVAQSINDVSESDVHRSGHHIDESRSLGDFGGMTDVGLPGNPFNDEDVAERKFPSISND